MAALAHGRPKISSSAATRFGYSTSTRTRIAWTWCLIRKKSDWCYGPNSKNAYSQGIKIEPDFLERSGYRLPTEAEWECACRAGAVTSRTYGGSVALLGKYSWYSQNSQDRAWPCGQVKPNDLGLFDLLGNVYEWCQDQLGSSPANDYAIAQLMANGSMVREKDPGLFRGGAFTDHAANVRSAYRNWVQPWNRSNNLGFRLARTCP